MVLDLDVVRDNYTAFARSLPDTRVFYAVKANPAPEVLSLLAEMGSCFDTASVAEIEMALAAGATPDRISFGNTIKKERCIGGRWPTASVSSRSICEAEVEKIARAADAAGLEAGAVQVFCRILCDGAGADWPLSRKFGCVPEMATDVLEHAHRQGLAAYGVSFTSARSRATPRRGRGAGLGRDDLPGVRRARDLPVDGQPRRWISRRST